MPFATRGQPKPRWRGPQVRTITEFCAAAVSVGIQNGTVAVFDLEKQHAERTLLLLPDRFRDGNRVIDAG